MGAGLRPSQIRNAMTRDHERSLLSYLRQKRDCLVVSPRYGQLGPEKTKKKLKAVSREVACGRQLVD